MSSIKHRDNNLTVKDMSCMSLEENLYFLHEGNLKFLPEVSFMENMKDCLKHHLS